MGLGACRIFRMTTPHDHRDVGGRVQKVGALGDAWISYRVDHVKPDRLLVGPVHV
jgi:hypothetical protein